MHKRKQVIGWCFIGISTFLLLIGICFHPRIQFQQPKPEIHYIENTTDELNVLLYCHSSDYFLYRGTPIGFQYELIKILSDSIGMKLHLTFSSEPADIKTNIYTSNYDIIAIDINEEEYTEYPLTFSHSHSTSFPVLIQRKKDTLAYDTLYIPAHFPVKPQAERWGKVIIDTVDAEDLFEYVQDKKVRYLCTDYNTAIMLLPFYPDLMISDTLGAEYERRWILNPANTTINQKINDWLERFTKSEAYKKLNEKYFHPRSRFLARASIEKRRGKISPYDATIRHYAKKYNLDWRLVSSIIFQESKFTTSSVGIGGSFGIMQMMPATAANFGIDSTSTVEQQLAAGIRLISSINKQFADIEDENERAYFIAASYNAGSGHIHDARRLCEKYGGNKNIWSEVESYLILKTEHKYYTDPVVTNGYYPGKHTVRYTKAVIDRYHGYKMSMPE
ncbi:MAG: transglycosylase SLT domain-containing protein [Bacteroidales bacterium]|nr:transglycosylase SLT domain-containing protein [Bacteroidales bacterium]